MNSRKNIALMLTAFVAAVSTTLLLTQRTQTNQPTQPEINRLNSEQINEPTPEFHIPQIPEEYNLLFVGDVMLARSVGEQILTGQNPFEHVLSLFSRHDLVIANLETVAADPAASVQAPGKLYTFNSPVETLQTLKTSGVDIVSLANNHTMDYGAEALLNTIANLDAAEILHVGAGKNLEEAYKPLYKTIGETTLAFIAVNDIENYFTNATESSPGNAPLDSVRVSAAIQEARANADIVIVMPHWGIEYDTYHSARQEEWGKLFIDSGADIVIGAHPHVVQDSQEYKGKMIYYSLGNFVFDGMCGMPNACASTALTVTIREGEVVNFASTEILISEDGKPEII